MPTKTNPLGVKGAGEAGCVGALPAVANALVDALSEFGVRHIEMPATPERVWRAMTGRDAAPLEYRDLQAGRSTTCRQSGG